jgi:hypothetical protein
MVAASETIALPCSPFSEVAGHFFAGCLGSSAPALPGAGVVCGLGRAQPGRPAQRKVVLLFWRQPHFGRLPVGTGGRDVGLLAAPL